MNALQAMGKAACAARATRLCSGWRATAFCFPGPERSSEARSRARGAHTRGAHLPIKVALLGTSIAWYVLPTTCAHTGTTHAHHVHLPRHALRRAGQSASVAAPCGSLNAGDMQPLPCCSLPV